VKSMTAAGSGRLGATLAEGKKKGGGA
jgi:hypothetical protein